MVEFRKRKLANGVTVLFEKREIPIVSVSIANRFGGAYEKGEVKGIAHFIEHLVFTGTERRTHEEISREIEKKGGEINAFTANEVTCFYFKMPSEHLFTGLDILTDVLKNPRFDKEKFEKEKKVILEEIKMYKDDPQKHVFEKIEEAMFEKPFGEGVIGSEETVRRMDRDFVYELFKKAYSGGYVVSVVGNADFDKICEYFEKNFENSGEGVERVEIAKKNSEVVEERQGIDQANFIFAVHAPLPSEDEFYALELLDSYLADGMSSRIFLKVREERGLAYAVKSTVAAERGYSYYLIYVGTVKSAVPEVKRLILEEFNNVEKMSERDLEEAKERVIGLKKMSVESSSRTMQELLFSELVDRAERHYEHEENIRKVRLEDVKKLAKKLVSEYSTAAVVPK